MPGLSPRPSTAELRPFLSHLFDESDDMHDEASGAHHQQASQKASGVHHRQASRERLAALKRRLALASSSQAYMYQGKALPAEADCRVATWFDMVPLPLGYAVGSFMFLVDGHVADTSVTILHHHLRRRLELLRRWRWVDLSRFQDPTERRHSHEQSRRR